MNEDVFPIQDGDFPASYVSLPEGKLSKLVPQNSFRKSQSSCSPSSDTDKGVVGLSSSCFLGETKSLPLDHRVRPGFPLMEWLKRNMSRPRLDIRHPKKSLPPKLAKHNRFGLLVRRFESNYRRIQCIIELPVLAHWAIFVHIHDC